MWTTRIFLGIVFGGVGFFLWFLLGLVREELSHMHRTPALTSASEMGTEVLRPLSQGRTIRPGRDVATVRTVLGTGAHPAGAARKERSCGI